MTSQRDHESESARSSRSDAGGGRAELLTEALRVIHTTVRGDEKSECWTIRKWLDERNLFHGDIQGTRRLVETVCEWALQGVREAPAEPQACGWQPIETCPLDGTVVLRPHVIWGAMDVRYKPNAVPGQPWSWVNGDYTTAWPDEALAPFWMPCPKAPPVALAPADKEQE